MNKYAWILIACGLIAGCGGGGGGSSSSTPTPTPTPPATSFTVGGTVTGLNGSVSLQNNSGDTITVSANGSFTFPTALSSGGQYSVTATNVLPNYYTCSVANGTGSVASANVSNVAVSCALVPQVAMACGGATSIGTGNVAPLVIDGFPCAAGGTAGAANNANVPYVTVKICAPGSTTNCQIIDHVSVDTGSSGIRMAAAALPASLQPGSNGLPLVAGSTAGHSLTECEIYVSSYVYGPVVSADIYIAGKQVKNANMQVFGASGYTPPTSCIGQGGAETDTIQAFGGNGLIGVGFDLLDQGDFYDCQNSAINTCSPTPISAYAGVPNIVPQFSSDNNGVVIALPSVSSAGLSSPVVGTLTFGVSTQANNTPAASTVAIVNDNTGSFQTQIGGTWNPAYIDSGTFVMFFNDPAANLALCTSNANSGFYCPATPVTVPLIVANAGSKVTAGTFNYQVGNADQINTVSAMAFSNIAGQTSGSSTLSNGSYVAYGLSFFYGREMYFLFNSKTAPGTGLGGTAATTVTGPINGIH
ncbi:DUF3443 family protein [Sapientia aquatica]|uniref:DUF3443 family protein n=1 Tax=Sapientia aquatica TaxID=1549640 RepID=A0A4R5W1J5_9BURK|nr:DUF3443 family protein [Sapientia aquatica]TDK66061.1 DUF3443 family protein [Sapientia aquatica]